MDDNLIINDISKEHMLFLVSANHPLAHKDKVTPYDLADTGVILTEPGCSYRLTMEKILKDFKTVPQSFLEASSSEAIKQLIMLGLGISMLPRFAVEKELAEGRIYAVRWNGPISQYLMQMLYHKDKWISLTLQAFLDTTRHFYGTKNRLHKNM